MRSDSARCVRVAFSLIVQSNVSSMTDDNPPTRRPHKNTGARAGIAVLTLTIVGGGIAIGLSLGGSPSPVHTSTAGAHTDKRGATSTATTTSPSTTPAVTPKIAATTGGNCTNPSFSSSKAEATDNTDPNDDHQYWWVNNDAWSGGHGPQTIDVCSQSSWYAVSNQPNVGGQVETYPSTEYDVSGRAADVSIGSTRPIGAFSHINSTFSEAFPSGGGWDAAYDLWTDDWKHETMIWNQWAGSNDYWPKKATIAVTLGGVGYTFYPNCKGPADAANEAHCEYMFFRDTQVTSGSVNILAAWQWEVANGYASPGDVPTQLEYGVEVSYTSGTETFPMTGLTFNVS